MEHKTAEVNVLHSIRTAAGWVNAGTTFLPYEEARQFAHGGHVEILSVDGVPYVYAPCCGDGGMEGV